MCEIGVYPLEVLPNGARALDCRRSSSGLCVMFAVWVKQARSEFAVWYIDPKTLACDTGYYTPDAGQAWANFVLRSS